MIAQRDGVVLRLASEEDLAAIDRLTAIGYAPIQESFVAMLGEDCYEAVLADPEQAWDERKAAQNRRLFAEHPEQVWVLDADGRIIGFVTFWLFPERQLRPPRQQRRRSRRARARAGRRSCTAHVLEHFRELGLRFAHVDTGLDDAHIPARRAYAAVGFDRSVPSVDLWQRL